MGVGDLGVLGCPILGVPRPPPPPAVCVPTPGWAAAVRFHPRVRDTLERFRRRPDTFSLGVCNGCQLLALLGWVGPPTGGCHGGGHPWVLVGCPMVGGGTHGWWWAIPWWGGRGAPMSEVVQGGGHVGIHSRGVVPSTHGCGGAPSWMGIHGGGCVPCLWVGWVLWWTGAPMGRVCVSPGGGVTCGCCHPLEGGAVPRGWQCPGGIPGGGGRVSLEVVVEIPWGVPGVSLG